MAVPHFRLHTLPPRAAIQDNRFVRRVLDRVSKFRTLTSRVETEPLAKQAAAQTFWDHKLNQLKRKHYRHIFIESGSSLAFVAEVFEEKTSKQDQDIWKVATNNALALLQLSLFTDLDTRPNPPAAPDPEDRYGAIFTRESLNAHEEPPRQPRRLYRAETEAIANTVKLLTDGVPEEQLILATASGWDTTHAEPLFRGPHVGSHANMLFKRALFQSGRPAVLFLTRRKIDPDFEEARFKCPDDEAPRKREGDAPLERDQRYCYPVFGLPDTEDELSLVDAVRRLATPPRNRTRRPAESAMRRS